MVVEPRSLRLATTPLGPRRQKPRRPPPRPSPEIDVEAAWDYLLHLKGIVHAKPHLLAMVLPHGLHPAPSLVVGLEDDELALSERARHHKHRHGENQGERQRRNRPAPNARPLLPGLLQRLLPARGEIVQEAVGARRGELASTLSAVFAAASRCAAAFSSMAFVVCLGPPLLEPLQPGHHMVARVEPRRQRLILSRLVFASAVHSS